MSERMANGNGMSDGMEKQQWKLDERFLLRMKKNKSSPQFFWEILFLYSPLSGSKKFLKLIYGESRVKRGNIYLWEKNDFSCEWTFDTRLWYIQRENIKYSMIVIQGLCFIFAIST